MAACGIAPEDDDGNAASQPKPQPSKASQRSDDSGPDPDAMILAQFNAAKDIPALTKVMNSIPQVDRGLYTSIFNARMGELKKAA